MDQVDISFSLPLLKTDLPLPFDPEMRGGMKKRIKRTALRVFLIVSSRGRELQTLIGGDASVC